jgi:hypothetical protein
MKPGKHVPEPLAEFNRYGPVAGWLLCVDVWWPTHVMRELGNGWAEWLILFDGGSESGIAKPGRWSM